MLVPHSNVSIANIPMLTSVTNALMDILPLVELVSLLVLKNNAYNAVLQTKINALNVFQDISLIKNQHNALLVLSLLVALNAFPISLTFA